MNKQQKPQFRLSAWRWALELRVTVNKLKAGFIAHQIEPAKGGYTCADAMKALAPRGSNLERRSKEAKYQRQIDQAKAAEAKLDYYKKNFSLTSDWEEFLDYLRPGMTKIVQQSPLSDVEKQLMFRIIEGMTLENFKRRPV